MNGRVPVAGLRDISPLWLAVPAAAGALALLTLNFDAPPVLAGLVAVMTLLVLVLRPVLATLVTVALLYANLPALAGRMYGVPTMVAASAVLLLALPLAHHLVLQRAGIRIDRTFRMMLLLLLVMSVSATFARVPDIAVGRVLGYGLEGVVLYWLVTNVVRDLPTLRRVVWTLLATGALLGALSVWQAATDSHGPRFGGLANREVRVMLAPDQEEAGDDAEIRLSPRAEGPVDDPNRFAQLLIVLLPLAVYVIRTAPSRTARLAAAGAGTLVLAGVLLTYSRAGFLVLVAMVPIAVAIRWLRPAHLLAGLVVVALVLPRIAPTYPDRIASIVGARAIMGDAPAVQADGAIRGRTTQMLAAWNVFLDHPVLGVGPGQYAPVYSVQYQTLPGVAFRDLSVPRRAHSLYLEMAAELGLVGLTVFLALVGLLLRDLWRERRGAHSGQRSDLVTAFALALVGYLATAVFLHLSFERYFWLLVALASAALHVARTGGRGPLAAPTVGGGSGGARLPGGGWGGPLRVAPAPGGGGGAGRPPGLVGNVGWRGGAVTEGSRPWPSRRTTPRAQAQPRALGQQATAPTHEQASVRTIEGPLVAEALLGHAFTAEVQAAPPGDRLAPAPSVRPALGAQREGGGGGTQGAEDVPRGVPAGRRAARIRARVSEAVGAVALALASLSRAALPLAGRPLQRAHAGTAEVWTLAARALATLRRRAAAAAQRIRTRYLYRALDAVVSAAAVPSAARPALARALFPLRQSNFKRIQAIAAAAEAVSPTFAKALRDHLIRGERLPFALPLSPAPLGYGAGATVYKLCGGATGGAEGGGDRVLKVLRDSVDLPVPQLLHWVRLMRDCYERVDEWYDREDLVGPVHFLVLQGPLLGHPVAAFVQPRVDGELRDLFSGMSARELIAALRRDAGFRAQFRRFVERTLDAAERTGRCLDLVGEENVLVVETEQGLRLKILDFGLLRLNDPDWTRPDVAREARRRMRRLARILHVVQDIDAGGDPSAPVRVRTRDSVLDTGEKSCQQ